MATDSSTPPPTYVWPKFVLAAVILFFLLGAVWLSREVARVQRIKAANAPWRTNAAGSLPVERQATNAHALPR